MRPPSPPQLKCAPAVGSIAYTPPSRTIENLTAPLQTSRVHTQDGGDGPPQPPATIGPCTHCGGPLYAGAPHRTAPLAHVGCAVHAARGTSSMAAAPLADSRNAPPSRRNEPRPSVDVEIVIPVCNEHALA